LTAKLVEGMMAETKRILSVTSCALRILQIQWEFCKYRVLLACKTRLHLKFGG